MPIVLLEMTGQHRLPLVQGSNLDLSFTSCVTLGNLFQPWVPYLKNETNRSSITGQEPRTSIPFLSSLLHDPDSTHLFQAARVEPSEQEGGGRGPGTLQPLLARSTLGKADGQLQGEPEAAPGHWQVQTPIRGLPRKLVT